MNIDSTIHLLQGRGFRMTSVRKFLLETFRDSRKPISAGDLIALLKKAKLDCNRTTVYRELTFLQEQSIIKSVDFGDGAKRFEAAGGAHHHHFVCTHCGLVLDINLKNDLESEEFNLEKTHGVKIASHSLEFFGLCKNCQTKTS